MKEFRLSGESTMMMLDEGRGNGRYLSSSELSQTGSAELKYKILYLAIHKKKSKPARAKVNAGLYVFWEVRNGDTILFHPKSHIFMCTIAVNTLD